jgi:rhodanese-related sulfurtransferase
MLRSAAATAILLLFSTSARAEDFGRMTVQEVAQKLKQPAFFVYDDNSAARYQKGHVPGAKLFNPYSPEARALPADKSATLVFYCANEECSACHDGARAALKLGYKNVFIMPAGIAGWEKAKLPTEKG